MKPRANKEAMATCNRDHRIGTNSSDPTTKGTTSETTKLREHRTTHDRIKDKAAMVQQT
jgi:hypothetical protein